MQNVRRKGEENEDRIGCPDMKQMGRDLIGEGKRN
jgi:hypothetical protein